jgi:hypothetical protein
MGMGEDGPRGDHLLETGHVVEMSLDFDLGDRDEVGDGYMVATWVEERVATDDDYIPPVIHVHSMASVLLLPSARFLAT